MLSLLPKIIIFFFIFNPIQSQLGSGNNTQYPFIINTDPNYVPNYPDDAWAQVIEESLLFFEAQRSGKLPTDNRIPWRHDSGLQDGIDQNVDLVGGYYDAGDYLKFTYPLSFTMTSISWGAIDWFQGYQLSNQTKYFDSMMRWGMNWLIKAHPKSNTIFVQVGLGKIDNNYWGPDTNIPTPRPSFQVNSSSPGTDVAADLAASFAAASIIYSESYLNDINYSNTLLQHAKDAFSFAETAHPFQTYQTAVPAVADLYSSNGFGDELAWGALWLYRATNDSTYYQKAVNYYKQYSLTSQQTVFNWDSKTAGLYVLFAQYNGGNNMTGWQIEAEKYFDLMISGGGGKSEISLTPGGLLWFSSDSKAASLNPSLNIAMLLLHYLPYTSSDIKRNKYLEFATNQTQYVLGSNPMNCPYIVGINPNSPQNPHHAGASGGTDINNIESNPAIESYILYGAIVGGPDNQDRFFDKRGDFDQTEVALDYNAPLQSISLYMIMNSHNNNTPSFVKLPAGSRIYPVYPSGGISKAGAIAITVVVIIFVLLIIGLGIFYREKIRNTCFKKRIQSPVAYLGN